MTQSQPPDDVAVRRDLVHTQDDGYRPLSLDLYVPAGGARAVAVYLHGGGWRRGSRRNGPGPLVATSDRLFARAARAGLAVASIDYRLSGEARFPAQCDDVDAACRYLDSHRADLQLGDAPLALWGVSAGGALAALRGLDPAAQPAIAAVALWYAVTDLRAMPGADGAGAQPSREALFLGAVPDDVPELATRASAVTRVHAGAPPFLLLHGDADELVPCVQSERMHQTLTEAGVPSTCHLLPGQQHMFAGMDDADVETWVDRTVAFLLDPSAAA